MGAFILGVLFGWLLEWLFFTYWIKGRTSGRFADVGCSNTKSKLAEKESEISSLKAELQDAKRAVEAAKSDTEAVKKVSEAVSSSSKAKSDTVVGKTTSAVVSNETSDKTKKDAKKTSTTKKQTATKNPAKAKKPVAKPKAKKAVSKKSNATKGDNFLKLTGIGPSMVVKLNGLGITTFRQLSEMDDDILRDQLEAAGAKLNNNKEAMDSWNEQAALADKGDFKGLKKLQESLKT